MSKITCTSKQSGDEADVARGIQLLPVLWNACVFFAGEDRNDKGQIMEYNIDDKAWNSIDIPCCGSESYALTTYHEKLLLIGGYSKEINGQCNKVWEFDEDGRTFKDSSLPPLPETKECRTISATSEGDLLVVICKDLEQNILVNIFDGNKNWITHPQPNNLRISSSDSVSVMICDALVYLVHQDRNKSSYSIYQASLQSLKDETISSSSSWEKIIPDPPKYNHSNLVFVQNRMLLFASSTCQSTLAFIYSPEYKCWNEIGEFGVEFNISPSYPVSISAVSLPKNQVLVMGWVKGKETREDNFVRCGPPSFEVLLLQPQGEYIKCEPNYVHV